MQLQEFFCYQCLGSALGSGAIQTGISSPCHLREMRSPYSSNSCTARLVPKKISIARLPITGGDVFGREEDMAFLDDAWAKQQVNVVTIVAWAGVGKSTLVNHWLRRMAAEQYHRKCNVMSFASKLLDCSADIERVPKNDHIRS
jgi:hypothetical protein